MTEEWRECVAWLARCQIIVPDHKVLKPEGRLLDLAYYLKDGVALCHLLNRLYPNAVDPKSFSQRPQTSQYLCKKNIRVFLDGCKNVFGLSDSILFQISDLFEMQDFDKVLKTLSALSQTSLAKKSVNTPFVLRHVQKNGLPRHMLEPVYDDDDEAIYSSFGVDEEDIYEALMDITPAPGLVIIQQPVEKSKRSLYVNELIETEKKYLDSLLLIKNAYMTPLTAVFDPADFKKIFLNIEELYEIHRTFHEELVKANVNSGLHQFTKTIPDCFIIWKERFLVYGEFCANLTSSQELLDQLCEKSPQINAKVLECQRAATGGKFKLRDLLCVPMQRILKYHLLLNELVKNTETNDPEMRPLKIALEEMRDLSLYVNEVKRDKETLQLINEIEKNIVNLSMPQNARLQDYGRMHKDGELKVKSSRETKSRNVFLFDKLMVLCKARNEVYYYKSFIELLQFQLDETPSKALNFSFTLKKRDGPEYFVFGAKTEDLRKQWIEVVKLAQDNAFPPQSKTDSHKFNMMSYDKPTICDVCRKLLRGVFFQGYKCQKTGLSVHKECISKSQNVAGPPRLPPPPQKVPQITRRPSLPQAVESRQRPIGSVRADASYNGAPNPGDSRRLITFDKGDIFDLLSDDTGDDWWLGQRKTLQGHFPRTFVTVIQRSNSTEAAPKEGRYIDHQPRTEPSTPDVGLNPSRAMSRRSTDPNIMTGMPPPPQPHRTCKPISQYVNAEMDLTPYAWYAGQVNQEGANRILEKLSNGSFLIRSRDSGAYALSIMYNAPKHIRIQEIEGKVTLDEANYFTSIPKLVEFYQTSSLEQCFSEVPTCLSIPYKSAETQMTGLHASKRYCRVIYDYSATEPNQLSLRVGDEIIIVNKSGESRGWWKGKLNDKVGSFPCTYVTEVENLDG